MKRNKTGFILFALNSPLVDSCGKSKVLFYYKYDRPIKNIKQNIGENIVGRVGFTKSALKLCD